MRSEEGVGEGRELHVVVEKAPSLERHRHRVPYDTI